ncbi:MAG: DegT/DnrJ/EryC1/StrS family aminotransferase [Chitinophagales bacterium]|nr:DegT/DnrJ/EryC1/StrS family aminotransferase [Chitinophagales bacterium]
MHERLEQAFANYVGTKYAVAVNTGGMALQMCKRAIGVKPGDEVIHQVDTCVANAFAAVNAFAIPRFSDIDLGTFMPGRQELEACITGKTKALIPIHIWGNAMDMDMVRDIANKHQLTIIEDGCLALGAKWKQENVGSMGHVGVFSFGCLKPIQAGEGGMITTNDEALAKELRTIRSYGDTSWEYNVRDNRTLSWNGRISEIVAAVAFEQLLGYPEFLRRLTENVAEFKKWLETIDGLSIQEGSYQNAYTQVVLKLEPLVMSKNDLKQAMEQVGINVWHANFEPITSLSFFRTDEWRTWLPETSHESVAKNFGGQFPNAWKLYNEVGLGIGRQHFISKANVRDLIKKMGNVLLKS